LSREVGRSDGKRDFPVGFEWVEEGLWGRLGGGGSGILEEDAWRWR